MAALTPPDFEVPTRAELGPFMFEPLMIGDVIADYDAVMTSVDHIAHTFGPNATWPQGLTLEQNLIDLGWHHKEFQRRTSFAYKVLGDPANVKLRFVPTYVQMAADGTL